MFLIFILMLIWSPCEIHCQQDTNSFVKLELPKNAIGPDDIAFDSSGQEFYTGIMNGKVLKYISNNNTFVDFATTSPLRTKLTCDGLLNPLFQSTCGRPLGLYFDRRTDDLYMTDIYFGLLKVGKNGGLATQLAAGVNGKNFSFADSVVLDESTGVVYFIDSGKVFRSINVAVIANSRDRSGRFLKYEPSTKQVTVLLDGLSGPAGVAISEDQSFIVITQFIARNIIKYYIKGPKANTTETLIENLEGFPDNVKPTTGGFWVAVSIPRMQPVVLPVPPTDSIAMKFDENGNILARRNVTNAHPNTFSVYYEYFDKAFTGSLVSTYVAKFTAEF